MMTVKLPLLGAILSAATKSPDKIRNTIVQYQGGGYDGCFWEWNYAYYDSEGNFHNIVATGYKGCEYEEALEDYMEAADEGSSNEYDLYKLDEEGEIARFGRETPISHLLTVGKWFAGEFPDVKLTVICEACGCEVEVASDDEDDCHGVGAHGIGGIMLEHDKIICAECHSNGTCAYCGEYNDPEDIDSETGYCTGKKHDEQWCLEQHGDH
jgi:hypothetical protein